VRVNLVILERRTGVAVQGLSSLSSLFSHNFYSGKPVLMRLVRTYLDEPEDAHHINCYLGDEASMYPQNLRKTGMTLERGNQTSRPFLAYLAFRSTFSCLKAPTGRLIALFSHKVHSFFLEMQRQEGPSLVVPRMGCKPRCW